MPRLSKAKRDSILQLHTKSELSVDEIANILKISVDTVEFVIFDGRQTKAAKETLRDGAADSLLTQLDKNCTLNDLLAQLFKASKCYLITECEFNNVGDS